MTAQLQQQVATLGLGDAVRFLGPLPPEELCLPLSAADVFVLATRNEGWANVLLEALACGVPVVATDVGGNAEVICRSDLGAIVPFDDHPALVDAIREALGHDWDREGIRQYAADNDWSTRIPVLVREFRSIARGRAGAAHA
jgi:glycosyltransferase involved in cell wall biosynthesis